MAAGWDAWADKGGAVGGWAAASREREEWEAGRFHWPIVTLIVIVIVLVLVIVRVRVGVRVIVKRWAGGLCTTAAGAPCRRGCPQV